MTKAFGILLPSERVAGAAAQTAGLWRSAGLDPLPFGGCYRHLYVDICPTALQPALPSHVRRRQPMRPVSHDRPPDGPRSTDPDWPADFPGVYLTLGTVFRNLLLLRSAVTGLARLGVGVLVTVGSRTDAIASAGDRLLREASFRTAAAGIAADIARMPGPDEVAVTLERIAR